MISAGILRVMVVEGHPSSSGCIQAALAVVPDIEVMPVAVDGSELIVRACKEKPDVILMDFPGETFDCIAATREIKQCLPDTSVIILTEGDSGCRIIDAICAGASGYLPKDSERSLLVMAILAAKAGALISDQSLMQRELARITVGCALGQYGEMATSDLDIETLTPREYMVLELLVKGYTNRQIGEHLAITEETAKKHVQSIIGKLKAADRTDAAVRAVRAHLC